MACGRATERLGGARRQPKAPPTARLKKRLTKSAKGDVKDQRAFADQGGELRRSKATRGLFKEGLGCETRVAGAGGRHQNRLFERADQTADKAIRAMLIGAGLPVKFWPSVFGRFLRIRSLALPRCGAAESAHQKLRGEKESLGLL